MRWEPKSWTYQPLLSCLLSREVLMHTKFTRPTKMGERVKHDDYFQEELTGEFREDRPGDEGETNKREMKREPTSGGKNCHCSLESISTHPQHSSNHTFYKMWKSCYLCEKGKREVKCTPRQCEDMPLQFLTHTVLSQGHRSAAKTL